MISSVCNIKYENFIGVRMLELCEGHAHLDPRMSCTHPEELGAELFNFMAEDDWHSVISFSLLSF
jgi:hypothetical protein